MRTSRIVFTAMFMFGVFFAQAQAQDHTEDKPFIEVTGTAETEIAPDEIFIDINVEERFDGRDKLTLQIQEDRLRKALQEIGVDLKNLSLSEANAAYVRVKWHGKDVVAKKNFKLKLSDAVTVGKLFEQLDKLEISNARISIMGHSKMDSIRRDIRIKAIKAAKEKADYLLSAIGSVTGKPLLIQEIPNLEAQGMPLNNANYAANVRYKLGDVEDREEDIQLRAIKVRSSIFVKFAIQ